MASPVLPPHSYAAQSLGGTLERIVPHGWPVWEVPNFSDWKPGDVVLVEANSWPIPAAQLLSTNPLRRSGFRWSHAAVYVGNGEVVDAVYPTGVITQTVWNYCQHRQIRVRRLNVPNIPTTHIQQIATVARSCVGQPYSRAQLLLSLLHLAGKPRHDELYCSTFVAFSIDDATGLDLSYLPAWQPIYPAILAMHPWLDDVPLEWRKY